MVAWEVRSLAPSKHSTPTAHLQQITDCRRPPLLHDFPASSRDPWLERIGELGEKFGAERPRGRAKSPSPQGIELCRRDDERGLCNGAGAGGKTWGHEPLSSLCETTAWSSVGLNRGVSAKIPSHRRQKDALCTCPKCHPNFMPPPPHPSVDTKNLPPN
jgi:hypothetical protein